MPGSSRCLRAALLLTGVVCLLPRPAAARDAAGPGEAARFARIFADHAVLQRDRPLTIWGRAGAGRSVTVRLAGRSAAGKADAGGRWEVTLPALPAGGPYDLVLTSDAEQVTLGDILIGDVFLCGGQSNMDFQTRYSTNALNGFPGEPRLRFVVVPKGSEPAPDADFKDPLAWKLATPDTVGDSSAVCYYMARSLQRSQGVPVGFISASWGGTTIQGWIGAPSLRTLDAYRPRLDALRLLATDRTAALEADERRMDDWWRTNVRGDPADRSWRESGFRDDGWEKMQVAGSWRQAGIPAFADFEGAAWFRGSVELTARQSGLGQALLLGPIDTVDSVWVNGRFVGSSTVGWMWRSYPLPKDLLKPGRNTIAIRILGKGGLSGPSSSRGLQLSSGEVVPLDADWRYRIGPRTRDLAAPAAPWEVPTSLATLYNGMIAPLAPYGIRLAAWYQGESNVGGDREYRTLLPLLMGDWRAAFRQPDLPFVVAQLSTIGTPSTGPGDSAWAAFRAMQADVVRADRHAGLAVTFDVGDRTDIHPTQKTVVGERLARVARAVAYGETVVAGGPEAQAVARCGDDLVVRFRNAAGLRTYSAAVAIGFEACSRTGCSYVAGRPEGDAIVLAGANRPDVTHVRYGWADAPYANLYNAEDLPAGPFDLPVAP